MPLSARRLRAKLSDKGYGVDKEVEAFTTGDDYLLDRELVEADCVASAAHARMLAKIGILTRDEAGKLAAELRAIAADNWSGEFTVEPADEDCHTAIENRLTARLGDLGKKIHTPRSRNDQVIAAIVLMEVGRRVGRRRLAHDPDGARTGVGAVDHALVELRQCIMT